jgi:hypothetical protein
MLWQHITNYGVKSTPIVSLPSTESMKTVLIVIVGILLWQSTDARQFTSNVLQGASDLIEPNNNQGPSIDNFLN